MILKLVINRLKIMSRNSMLIMICIIAPIAFSILMNSIFSKKEIYERVPIGIIDQDNSTTTGSIIDSIEKNNAIDVVRLRESDIENYINNEKVQAIYFFKKGTEQDIIKDNTEGLVQVYTVNGSITAMGISDIIAGEILPYISSWKVINRASQLAGNTEKQQIQRDIEKLISEINDEEDFNMPVHVSKVWPESGVEDVSTGKENFSIEFGFGIIIIFSTLFMMAACSNIIKEKNNMVFSRTRASGVSSLKIATGDILALSVGGLIMVLLQLIPVLLWFGEFNLSNLWQLLIVSTFHIVTAAAMLFMFTSFFKSTVSFQSFIPVLILLMGIAGGCLWSKELMPQAFQGISKLVPFYWAHNGFVKIFAGGSSAQTVSVMENIKMLFFMTVAFIIVSTIKTKHDIQA